MKLTKLALIALGSLVGVGAQAATLNVNNFGSLTGGSPSLVLLDNAGNPLTAGSVALYTFASTPTSPADVLAGNQLAIDVLNAGNNPGPGAYVSALSAANDGSLNGQNLFLVISDGPNPASSTGWGVIDTGLSFSKADTPPPPESLLYQLSTGATVVPGLGSITPVTVDWSGFGGPAALQTSGLQLVPEPSSTLLFGLAGLALLIRRKR